MPQKGGIMAEASTKECDFCKEEIRADAIRCKHCGSVVGSPGPTHGGTCPYCKEEINADAIKCKHCGSWVGDTTHAGSGWECGCGGTEPGSHARFGVPPSSSRGQTASPSMMQSAGLRRPRPGGGVTSAAHSIQATRGTARGIGVGRGRNRLGYALSARSATSPEPEPTPAKMGSPAPQDGQGSPMPCA
jgi:hypothetical protein